MIITNDFFKECSEFDVNFNESDDVTFRNEDSIKFNNPEVSLCTLSAINLTDIDNLQELEELCELTIFSLNQLIDNTNYPLLEAELSATRGRYLGVGFTGLATYLAKHHLKYSDPESIPLVHDLSESMLYYLIKASCNMAKDTGHCLWYHKTKYFKDIFPIDTYKEYIDQLYPKNTYKLDWDKLKTDVKLYGLKNSSHFALMPCQSSSVVNNSSNGVEPVRSGIQNISSKSGILKQVLPKYNELKDNYDFVWNNSNFNTGYLNLMGIFQKFCDQSISTNTYYNLSFYNDQKIPLNVIVNDIFYAYKLGLKSLYYQNIYDGRDENEIEQEPQGCSSGSCSI